MCVCMCASEPLKVLCARPSYYIKLHYLLSFVLLMPPCKYTTEGIVYKKVATQRNLFFFYIKPKDIARPVSLNLKSVLCNNNVKIISAVGHGFTV